jgi:hypothetical protein
MRTTPQMGVFHQPVDRVGGSIAQAALKGNLSPLLAILGHSPLGNYHFFCYHPVSSLI